MMPIPEVEELKRQVADLRNTVSKLQALQATLEPALALLRDANVRSFLGKAVGGASSLRLGSSVDIAVSNAPTPAYFNIGGGTPIPSALAGGLENASIYPSINIADQQDIFTATHWGSVGAYTQANGSTVDDTALTLSVDKFDPRKAQMGSAQAASLAQVQIVSRIAGSPSYMGGLGGPYDAGTASITASNTSFADSSQAWATNVFAGCLLTLMDGSGNVAVHEVASNTATAITSSTAFTLSGTCTYVIYRPMVLGATFLPWHGIRIAPYNDTSKTGMLRGMGSGAAGLVIYNPRNYAASTLSGTAKTVEISIDGTPYYFSVYPTKS